MANQTGIDLDAALSKNLEKKTKRDSERHHNIYFHHNPVNFQVFYVGKGKYQGSFEFRAYSKFSRNPHWKNTVNKYGYKVFLCHNCKEENEAFYWEKFYVKLFGRRDLGTGTLVNLTNGGEGSTISEETRRKISEKLKGKKKSVTHCQRLKESHVGMLGKKRTQESKDKFSMIKTLSAEEFYKKGQIMYAIWLEKFGKKKADYLLARRLSKRTQKQLS